MGVESPAFANASGSYTAEQTRRAIFAMLARTSANSPGVIAGGLLSASDLQLSAPASGMSVNVGTGECVIGGTEGAAQGGYYARATSASSLVVSAANASNPRVDVVCATVSDSGYTEPSGGSGNQWALQVVTGTPTAGATLSNLSGAPVLPASSLLLGYVLVPASAVSVTAANISNVAPVAAVGLFAKWSVVQTNATSIAAVAGQYYWAYNPPATVTLPQNPKAGDEVLVTAYNASAANPVTVSSGAAGQTIIGAGLSGTSFLLGTNGAFARLLFDSTRWNIVAGQQDTGWVAISSFSTGWAAYSAGVPGPYAASYRVVGDRAYLSGGAIASTGASNAITTLPAVARPALSVYPTGGFNRGGATACYLTVATNGTLTAQPPGTAINAGDIVYLDNATYRLS